MPATRDIATHRPVAAWLPKCCAVLFTTVVVGGVTRPTHSSLSIVEWQPLVGALPLYPQFGTEPDGYYIPPRWVPRA